MADATLTLDANTRLIDERIAESARKAEAAFSKVSIGKNNGLGSITGQANDFNNALKAAEARVVTFGLAAGAIFKVQQAFESLVTSTIDVEKALADINVILNANSQGLAKFSQSLFNVAKETGQSFDAVSKAAIEFTRQGLGVEQTLLRTRDALILVRLAGISEKEAVDALTAGINSFGKSVVSSTDIINKLAHVDAAFAVSSADLAEAIKRVGSTAEDSGVSLDQLIALTTSAQQITARGGAVIGNALKTIFQRVERPQTIAQLEDLGFAIRNLTTGEVLPAVDILLKLGAGFDKLGKSQQNQIVQLSSGLFQANQFRAILSDLSKGGLSIYAQALDKSTSATNEAIDRNKELDKTLSSLLNKTSNNFKQFASNVGGSTVGPFIRGILDSVNDVLGSSNNQEIGSQGEKIGKQIADGIGRGLSTTGASLVFVALSKLAITFLSYLKDSLGKLLSINSSLRESGEIEAAILFTKKAQAAFQDTITKGTKDILITERELAKTIQEYQTSQIQNETKILSLLREKAVVSKEAFTFGTVGVRLSKDELALKQANSFTAQYDPNRRVFGPGGVLTTGSFINPNTGKPLSEAAGRLAGGLKSGEEILGPAGLAPLIRANQLENILERNRIDRLAKEVSASNFRKRALDESIAAEKELTAQQKRNSLIRGAAFTAGAIGVPILAESAIAFNGNNSIDKRRQNSVIGGLSDTASFAITGAIVGGGAPGAIVGGVFGALKSVYEIFKSWDDILPDLAANLEKAKNASSTTSDKLSQLSVIVDKIKGIESGEIKASPTQLANLRRDKQSLLLEFAPQDRDSLLKSLSDGSGKLLSEVSEKINKRLENSLLVSSISSNFGNAGKGDPSQTKSEFQRVVNDILKLPTTSGGTVLQNVLSPGDATRRNAQGNLIKASGLADAIDDLQKEGAKTGFQQFNDAAEKLIPEAVNNLKDLVSALKLSPDAREALQNIIDNKAVKSNGRLDVDFVKGFAKTFLDTLKVAIPDIASATSAIPNAKRGPFNLSPGTSPTDFLKSLNLDVRGNEIAASNRLREINLQGRSDTRAFRGNLSLINNPNLGELDVLAARNRIDVNKVQDQFGIGDVQRRSTLFKNVNSLSEATAKAFEGKSGTSFEDTSKILESLSNLLNDTSDFANGKTNIGELSKKIDEIEKKTLESFSSNPEDQKKFEDVFKSVGEFLQGYKDATKEAGAISSNDVKKLNEQLTLSSQGFRVNNSLIRGSKNQELISNISNLQGAKSSGNTDFIEQFSNVLEKFINDFGKLGIFDPKRASQLANGSFKNFIDSPEFQRINPTLSPARQDLLYQNASSKIKNGQAFPGGDVLDVFSGGFKYDQKDFFQSITDEAKNAATVLKDAFKGAFDSFANSAKSGKEAFRDFALSLTKTIGAKAFGIGIDSFFGGLQQLGTNLFSPNKAATGGQVTAGSGTKDDVPYLLTKGEYILNKNVVAKLGARNLDAINNGANLNFENSYNYSGSHPTSGSARTSSQLTSFALEDDNNPQNALRLGREQGLFNYLQGKRAYDAQNAQTLKDFNKQQQNALLSAYIQAGIGVAGAGLQYGLSKPSTPNINAANFGQGGYGNLGSASLNGFEVGKDYAQFNNLFKGRASGGQISRSDTVPTMLTPGEYVTNADSVRKVGVGFMESINRGVKPGVESGGYDSGSSAKMLEILQSISENIKSTNQAAASPGGNVYSSISIVINKDGNVDASTSNSNSKDGNKKEDSDPEQSRKLSELVKGTVLKVINEQQRPGGLLYGSKKA